MGLAVLIASGLLVAALRGGSYAVIPRTQDAIAVWWVIGLSVAFGLLPRHRWSVEVRLAVAGLLGLAAWTALGLLWTDSTERTLEEALRVLSYAGLVMLVAWSFGARDRTRVVVLVTAVAGVVCLLALLSRVAPELLGTQSTSGSYDTTRLAYPFNYWNAVGCWGAMTLALALPLSAHARRRWLRAAALCLASLAPVVVYLTYSRTAALGVVLVVVLVVALSPQRWFVAANALIAGVGATAAVLTIRGAPEIARGSGTAGRGSVVLVLALVGLLTVAVALVGPHERLRRVRMPLGAARIALAGSLAAILVVAILAGPRAWDSFQLGSPRPRIPSSGSPSCREHDACSGPRRWTHSAGHCSAWAPGRTSSPGTATSAGRTCGTRTRSTSRRSPSSACQVRSCSWWRSGAADGRPAPFPASTDDTARAVQRDASSRWSCSASPPGSTGCGSRPP